MIAGIACISLLCANLVAHAAEESIKKLNTSNGTRNNSRSYRYVLNLESVFKKNNNPWLPEISALKQYALYTMPYKHKGKLWFRLRLGFFTSRANANRMLKILKPYFPGVWIDRISSDEFSRMKTWSESRAVNGIDKKSTLTIAAIKTTDVKNIKPSKGKRNNSQLMELAKRSLAKKRFREAAQYYMRVLSSKDEEHKQEAQELLGLSREKNGQLAHAKAEYRKYIKLYPEGEGVDRVRQRLLALTTARNIPSSRKKIKSKDEVYWTSFGSLSQFLRQDVSKADDITIKNESLETDLLVSARRRSNKYDFKTFMSGSHLHDIDESNRKDKERLSSLYAELIERQGSYMGRIGRFTHNSDGVFSRMDGVWGNYGISNKWKLNLVAGYPVELTTTNRSVKDKPFYSVGLYAGTFEQRWDYNVYFFNREVESMLDRQSVGTELRYLGTTQTAFALLDYDVYFNKLNTFFAVSNWRLPQNSLVNLTLNYRMSPFLTTSSALQGQGTTSVDILKQTRSEEEIKQLALDRTATYKALTLSGTRELTKKYSINGEITVSNLSGTSASGGVEATPSTGNEYFYGIQLIGVNLYSENDTSIGEVRYEDTSNYQKYKLSASTRWRGKKKWSYRPKLSYEIRDNSDGSEMEKIVPSVRIDHRYNKKVKFEFELQYEDITRKSTIQSKESNYSISIGYIYDFF